MYPDSSAACLAQDGGDGAPGRLVLEVADVGDEDELAARAGQADVEQVPRIGLPPTAGQQHPGAHRGRIDEVDDHDVDDEDELAARAGQADVEQVPRIGLPPTAGQQHPGAHRGRIDEVDDHDV